MKTGRRFFLSGVAAMLAGTRPLLVSGQIQRRDGPPLVPQNPQTPGIGSASTEENPAPPRPDPKTILKEDQKSLRKDVDHLLQMAKVMKHSAILRGMSTGEGAHGRAKFYMHTGYKEGVGGLNYPSIGSLVSKELGRSDFPLPSSNVPCKVQPPFHWGSIAPTTPNGYYPHLTATKP